MPSKALELNEKWTWTFFGLSSLLPVSILEDVAFLLFETLLESFSDDDFPISLRMKVIKEHACTRMAIRHREYAR